MKLHHNCICYLFIGLYFFNIDATGFGNYTILFLGEQVLEKDG